MTLGARACLVAICLTGCVAVRTPPLPDAIALPSVTPVIDRRAEFAPRFEAARRHWSVPSEAPVDDRAILHLPSSSTAPTTPPTPPAVDPATIAILVVPGFMGDAADPPYRHAVEDLRGRGFEVQYLPVAGASSTTDNARRIAIAIAGRPAGDGKRLILVGHSKGATDILHFLIDHPGHAARVAAVLSIAGAVQGSPLAEDVPWMPDVFTLVPALLDGRLGDARGLVSLRRTRQGAWLATHRLPRRVRYYTIAAAADRAHLSGILRPYYDEIAVVDPIADGLIAFVDQLVPDSALLAIANSDHVALVYEKDDLPWPARPFLTQNAFPRSALFEAAIAFVVEDLARAR